jgi:hypothetical protein
LRGEGFEMVDPILGRYRRITGDLTRDDIPVIVRRA